DPATDEQWPTTQLAHEQAVNSVACPGVDLCVAVDSRGNAFVSSDPGSAQPTWTASSIDREDLTAISCPSELLCVAVDRAGGVLTSTDPAQGAGAWGAPFEIDQAGATQPDGAPLVAPGPGEVLGVPSGYPDLSSVACPDVHLCVAVDAYGNVFTSSDASAGASAWTANV